MKEEACVSAARVVGATADLNLEVKQQKVVKMERELTEACAKREQKEQACH